MEEKAILSKNVFFRGIEVFEKTHPLEKLTFWKDRTLLKKLSSLKTRFLGRMELCRKTYPVKKQTL